MAVGVEAVRILELGVTEAHRLRLRIHHLDELLLGAANVPGDGDGRVVAAREHQPVEQRFERHRSGPGISPMTVLSVVAASSLLSTSTVQRSSRLAVLDAPRLPS